MKKKKSKPLQIFQLSSTNKFKDNESEYGTNF